MKNITVFVTLTVFVLTAAPGLMSGQSVDLSGTWVGETEIPDTIEPDVMTLVIIEEDGVYSAKVSDSMGMLDNTECKDIQFTENTFTFSCEVNTGEEYSIAYINLKVEGDIMTGFWEIDDGSTGPIELKKK